MKKAFQHFCTSDVDASKVEGMDDPRSDFTDVSTCIPQSFLQFSSYELPEQPSYILYLIRQPSVSNCFFIFSVSKGNIVTTKDGCFETSQYRFIFLCTFVYMYIQINSVFTITIQLNKGICRIEILKRRSYIT